jgi:hypothetical protein
MGVPNQGSGPSTPWSPDGTYPTRRVRPRRGGLWHQRDLPAGVEPGVLQDGRRAACALHVCAAAVHRGRPALLLPTAELEAGRLAVPGA